MDWNTQDKRSDWTRLSTQGYEDIAWSRIESIVAAINSGSAPMGRLNLFSQLNAGVWYPYQGQAERMANRLWQKLEQLIGQQDETHVLARYNFEIYLRSVGNDLQGLDLATIMFRYNPDMQDLVASSNRDEEE